MARPSEPTTVPSQRSGLQTAASCIVVCIAILVPLLLVVSHIDPHAGHVHLSDDEVHAAVDPSSVQSAIPAASGARLQPQSTADLSPDPVGITADSEFGAVAVSGSEIRTVSAADPIELAGGLTAASVPSDQNPQTTRPTESFQSCETVCYSETQPGERVATITEGESTPCELGTGISLANSGGPVSLAEPESSSEAEPWQWRPLNDTEKDLLHESSESGQSTADVFQESAASDRIAGNSVQKMPEPKSASVPDRNVRSKATAEKPAPFVVPEMADRRIQFFSARPANHGATEPGETQRNSSVSGSGNNSFHLASGERDFRPQAQETTDPTGDLEQQSEHAVIVDDASNAGVPQIVIHNHINTPAAPTVPVERPTLDPRIAQLQQQLAELTEAIKPHAVQKPEFDSHAALQQQQRTTMAIDANTAALQEIRLSLAELRMNLRESQVKENETSRHLSAQVSRFMTAVEALQDRLSSDRATAQIAIQSPEPVEPLYPPASARESGNTRPSMTAQRPRTSDFPGSPLIRPRNTGTVSTRNFAVRQPGPVAETPSARAAASAADSTGALSADLQPSVNSTKPRMPVVSPLPTDPAAPKVTWPAPRQIPVPLPKTIGTESPVEAPDSRRSPSVPAPRSTGLRVPSDRVLQESPVPQPFPPTTMQPVSQPAAPKAGSASVVPRADAPQTLPERNHAYVFAAPPANRTERKDVIRSITAVSQGTSTVASQKPRTTSARATDHSDQYTAHRPAPLPVPTATGRIRLAEVGGPQVSRVPQVQPIDPTALTVRNSSQPGFMTRTRTRIGDITDSITDLRPAWMDGPGRRKSERQWATGSGSGLSRVGNNNSGRFGPVRARRSNGNESKPLHRTGAVLSHLFRTDSVSE